MLPLREEALRKHPCRNERSISMDEKEKQELKNTAETVSCEATADSDLLSADIPNIDLYLDQILALVADKNHEAGDVFKERNLTKMMVNNYAKAGLVSPPNGKKYSKKHIIQMLTVNNLKSTLSLSKIKQISDGLDIQNIPVSRIVDVYDEAVADKEEMRLIASDVIDRLMSRDGSKNEVLARAVFSLAALSSYLKEAAELIADIECPVEQEEKKKKE